MSWKWKSRFSGAIYIGFGAALLFLFGCSSTPTSTSVSTTASTFSAPAVAGATCHSVNNLPDPVCTPGVADPRVTQANIATTICKSGYSKTVRPPVSYTNPLKLAQMRQYGFSGPPSKFEEDHLISLELGGSPTDPKNLWPEPGGSPNPKDKTENRLHAEVCSGQITLAVAQHAIATNWQTAP